jgi:hypothetical protein
MLNKKRNIVGRKICDNIHFLKTLAKSKSERKRRKLLKKASTDELLSIVESALNIIKANFHLTTRQRRKILPHAEFVRQLARVRSEKGAKQIIQRGDGAAFAAILVPILIEAFRYLSTQNS